MAHKNLIPKYYRTFINTMDGKTASILVEALSIKDAQNKLRAFYGKKSWNMSHVVSLSKD